MGTELRTLREGERWSWGGFSRGVGSSASAGDGEYSRGGGKHGGQHPACVFLSSCPASA